MRSRGASTRDSEACRCSVAVDVNAAARAVASITDPAANGAPGSAGAIQSSTIVDARLSVAPAACQQASQSADMNRSINCCGGGGLHAGLTAACPATAKQSADAASGARVQRDETKSTPRMRS